MPVATSRLPHCPCQPGLPEPPPPPPAPRPCSPVNDRSWSSLPHVLLSGAAPCSPFLPELRLGSGRQVFNLSLLLLLLQIWLYRRRTQPLPTPGASLQATQDIFSFCPLMSPFPLDCPVRQPSSPPRETTHGSGVLRLPYGDSYVVEVSVLGNICGL